MAAVSATRVRWGWLLVGVLVIMDVAALGLRVAAQNGAATESDATAGGFTRAAVARTTERGRRPSVRDAAHVLSTSPTTAGERRS